MFAAQSRSGEKTHGRSPHGRTAVSAPAPARSRAPFSPDPGPKARVQASQQASVRATLRGLKPQESALLLLRHAGLSYAELAAALELNPASIGTLLARAERRFKENHHES